MHEHIKILPKYMLKCHKGPTQAQSKQMGQSLIKKIENILHKNKIFPTLSKKYPTHEKPRI